MFDYMKLSKLIPTICDEKKIRYARTSRIPVNVEKYLNSNDIQMEGCVTFYNEEDIRIFIIYGKSEHAMMHDIIDSKYTFCVFSDYILSKEVEYMQMYNIIYGIIRHIMKYAFPEFRYDNDTMKSIFYTDILRMAIKDTFKLGIDKIIAQMSVYNIWAIAGDRFLDEYKEKYPEYSEDIENVMVLFDQIR